MEALNLQSFTNNGDVIIWKILEQDVKQETNKLF